MKLWRRVVLFITVLSTQASIYQTVPGEGFIASLAEEAASSHSLGLNFSNDNVQTQLRHQLPPLRPCSESGTPLSTSKVELKNSQRTRISKRKFGDVSLTENHSGKAISQISSTDSELNWDLDSLDSSFSHSGKPTDDDNLIFWNTFNQMTSGDLKRLHLSDYPSSLHSEFGDLEDLGNFSENSDYWNAFIKDLRLDSDGNLDQVHTNDEAGKKLPAIPLENPTTPSSWETKYEEYNSLRQLKRLMAYKAPNSSSPLKKKKIENYMDRIFNMKTRKNLQIQKILGVNEKANVAPESKYKLGFNHVERNVDSQPLQEPNDLPILGLFGFQERVDRMSEESALNLSIKELIIHSAEF
ncbi:hypothetical protein PPACK8108_LOCUS7905 [Phakopsora pachyrhizi]|uniref:Uncharacterized protein n=1 Tax=Phakopsora pachyrhizi TaxID=170000 RepID=A0AAV0AWL1_PHAPC|nr:hypothetical protein PPACK8108_LOCUS7905 [Phakopsora pachyrhizi]